MTALHTTNGKGHGCDPVPFAHHLISGLDSDCTIHNSKAEANLIASLALAGHSVYELRNAGYVVSKYGYTYQATDLEELRSFAVRLGVTHD
jgi:hypothetical protein